jgi:hypothetical protein
MTVYWTSSWIHTLTTLLLAYVFLIGSPTSITGAYSAVYFLNSTKHYQLAQSVLRREDKMLDVDVELPETKWLDELRYRYDVYSVHVVCVDNIILL